MVLNSLCTTYRALNIDEKKQFLLILAQDLHVNTQMVCTLMLSSAAKPTTDRILLRCNRVCSISRTIWQRSKLLSQEQPRRHQHTLLFGTTTTLSATCARFATFEALSRRCMRLVAIRCWMNVLAALRPGIVDLFPADFISTRGRHALPCAHESRSARYSSQELSARCGSVGIAVAGCQSEGKNLHPSLTLMVL